MKSFFRTLPAVAAAAMLAAPIAAQTGVDRTKRPASATTATLKFPAVTRRALPNGLKLAVLENHELPLVSVQVIVEARGLLDPPDKDGLVTILQRMLSEGTTSKTADQIAELSADLGSPVAPTFFNAVTPNVDRALELMSDQLMHPAFPPAALDRQKANEIATLKRLQDQPAYIADRLFSKVVYGPGHPYERTRTEQSLNAITRDDLVKFHDAYYRPQNVTIVVAGDITPGDAASKIEKAFGSWAKGGVTTKYDIPPVRPGEPTKIYLFDRPNSPQSVLQVGEIGPRRDNPDYYAIEIANSILGGVFNSRINLNLRERHAFTYGASSGFLWRAVPEVGTFRAFTQVVTPKTDSALVELVNEIKDIRGTRPITPAELEFAHSQQTRSLPLQLETLGAMTAAVADVLRNNLPADYYDKVTANMLGVTLGQANAATQKYIDPDHLAIVVVGDRLQIESRLRAANIAPVVVVDVNGNPVAP